MLDGAPRLLVCALVWVVRSAGAGCGEKRLLSEGLGLPILIGFRAQGEDEKQTCLREGRNLTVHCIYNIMLYASSLKAWQRVRSQGPPETLVGTSTRHADGNQARAGRYLLEDDPINAVISVTVTGLQRQDLGLYQCVINLSPKNPLVLFPRIRLVACEGEQRQSPGREGPWRLRLSPGPGASGGAGCFAGRAQRNGGSAPRGIGAPRVAAPLLCDFQKVIAPRWASVFSPVKVRKLD